MGKKTLVLAGLLFLLLMVRASAADDPVVGWYEVEPGRFALVTWGASGGLRLYDFETPRFEKLAPGAGAAYVWKHGEVERQADFARGRDGRVTALEWKAPDGTSGRAPRSDRHGYAQEEVRFESGGVTLAGVLLLPRTAGPHPGAVFIHGSGESDRDNVWAFSIANHLAMSGVAVLLPDKRGSGKSGGDWKQADFGVLAEDALAAARLLRARAGVDARRVGLVGLSQGGWIAPLAASRDRSIAFVAAVSGASTTVGEQAAHELEQTFRRAGLDEKEIAKIRPVLDRAGRYMKTGKGWDEYLAARATLAAPMAPAFMESKEDWRWAWYRAVLDFDPIPLWKGLAVPSLVVYGAEDERDNVPVAESLARLERLASPRITVKVYAGSGHAIEDPQTKWIRREFLDELARWVRATRPAGAG